jgi:GAF domain-containing protein
MTPAIFTEEAIEFLIHSGWRQFLVDKQFNLMPPCTALAELCNVSPKTLENYPLLNIFSPPDRENLRPLLSQLTQEPGQIISAIVLTLEVTDKQPETVELMLYSAPTKNPQADYIGFIRSLPTSQNIVQQKHLQNRNFEALAQLSRHIAATSDLDTLLDEVVESLSQDFKYKYVSIFLTDTNETTLTLKSLSSIDIASLDSNCLSLPIADKTIVGRVAITAKPLLVNHISEDDYHLLDYLPITTQSELAVPLAAGGQILGILDVQSDQPDDYNTDDQLLLETIAGQLAVAIENAHLFEERDRRMAELIAFNQIGIVIAEHSDLQTVFSNIVQRVSALLQVEAVSLLLLEKDNLRFVAATGAGAEDIQSFTLKPGQGIAWSVIETGRSIRVDNVKVDSRHFSGIDSAIKFSTCSLLAVPIQIQDRVLGLIEAVNRLDGRPFSREDEATLESIVASVAIVIENTRLFRQIQRQVDRVEGLLEASHAINTLDLQDILDTIVQRVSALLKADHTVVYLADYETQKINATAAHTSSDMARVSTPAFDFDQGTVGWVLKHQESLRINDTSKDERFVFISSESHLVTNLVSVPLVVKGESIGVLEATHKAGGGDFTVDDESLLSAFASQAAVAIHNARLYRETERQVKALTTLTQASEGITKAVNLDQLLNIVLNFSMSVIGAKAGAIILADTQTQLLRIEAAHNIAQDTITNFNQLSISHTIGTFGETYRTREIIEVVDSDSDSRVFLPAEISQDLPASFTNVPLFSRDDFIGVIFLDTLPDNDNRALLKAIADIAAVSIDKARLFKETNQRLAEVSTLYTLADQLTKVLDLDVVIESSVTILKHALDCSSCCLFLKQESGDKGLILKACSGWPELEQKRAEIDYINSLAKALISRPHPIYIQDVTTDFLILPELEKTPFNQQKKAGEQPFELGSVMIVPLIVKEELLGALSINDKRPNAFGQAEGRLLTIAAAQISSAIENTRLYDNLEQRAVELEFALKEVEEANRLKSEFVQNVSHELRTPLTFIKAYVELILEGSLGKIPQKAKNKLRIISQKADAITRLVEDIVSLQKIEAGTLRFESIGIHELVTRAQELASASAAEHNIEIVANSEPDLPEVRVDVDRIGQIFDNLVGNALKFSRPGSKINITAELDNGKAKFSIQDHGIGIPPDKLGKVFERFYQVDGSTTRRHGGAGLGLTIVKQIIEAHGGYITVASKLDKGTTFSFWLSIEQDASAEASLQSEKVAT